MNKEAAESSFFFFFFFCKNKTEKYGFILVSYSKKGILYTIRIISVDFSNINICRYLFLGQIIFKM